MNESDFPIQLTAKRWVFEKIKLNGGGYKLLDQDEFAYSYLVLNFIKNQPKSTLPSAYQVTKFFRRFFRSGSKYDQQTFRYLYLMSARTPALIVLTERLDEHTGQKTRINATITPAGFKWLKEKKEMAKLALDIKSR